MGESDTHQWEFLYEWIFYGIDVPCSRYIFGMIPDDSMTILPGLA